MTQLISAPCKKGFDVKLTDIISSYVRETYGDEQCTSHGNAFTEFTNMRSKMLNKLFDKHESALNILTKYYDQFVALESKIPMEENGVRIDFKWEDAFSKESLFGKKNTLKIASGGYERICVLYNIAALLSQVAETQNLNDESGLKTAAKFNQQAAGIFSYLRNIVPSIIQREPTVDLNGDTLAALSSIMLAQSQELIFIKAVRDNMKDSMVAKIVQHVADLYAEALKLVQLHSVKSIWPKEWIPIISGKEAGYHAMAEYHQGKSCGADQKFGEEITRLRKAMELMKTASSRSGAKFSFRSEQDRIRRDLDTVEKENNMIYHDTIPDVKSLSTIGKAAIAKELPIESPFNKDFKDLFVKIVPLELHSAVVMFENKKKMMTNNEVFRLKEATDNLNGILTSLNLPGAVEDSQGDDIPNNLLTKSVEVVTNGGIAKLENLINCLPDLTSRNSDILNESIKMLDDEEESDKKLREQFKERWNRTPSAKLTEGWRSESTKFLNLMKQAKAADETIRATFNQHNNNIRMLSQSEQKLKDSIPKSSSVTPSGTSDNVKMELRRLCHDAESIKGARQDFIAEIQNMDSNSLTTEFTRKINDDSSLDKEQLADEKINTMLIPMRERVRESLEQQERLLKEIHANATSLTTNNSTGGSDRASIISSLLVSADKFNELIGNLEESQKFYADLTNIFLKFQNKVQDFCFARKTEKDELMKDLQTTITRERTEHNPQSQPNVTPTYNATTDYSAGPPRPSPTYQSATPQVQSAAPNAPQPMNPHHPTPQQPPYMNPGPNIPYPPTPYQMPQPSYMAGMPQMYGVPPPGSGYQQPGTGYQQPGTGYQQPGQIPQPPQQQYQPGYGPGNNYNPGYNPYYQR